MALVFSVLIEGAKLALTRGGRLDGFVVRQEMLWQSQQRHGMRRGHRAKVLSLAGPS
jgi:hypothetical protein